MEGSLVFLILMVAILAAVRKLLSSPAIKGMLGEWAVHTTLEKALPTPDYATLRDVTLRTAQGTTQIDHIVVSRFGIFVIETKNMSGWIFGSERDSQWTQSFPKSKARFQNPLRQNYAHTVALQELLGLDSSKLHSIVVFTGDAKFKTRMPPNVMSRGRLIAYIRNFNTPVLGLGEVGRTVRSIESGRLEAGSATHAWHVESLRGRLGLIDGVVKDARGFMQHGIKTLRALKALAGVGMLLILLMLGSYFIKSLQGLATIGSAPTAAPSGLNPAQPLPGAPAANRGLLPAAQSTLQTIQQQQADERYQAWLRTLLCGYSSDTMRCACYDPKAGKVEMTFDECKHLAEKNSGVARLR